MKPWFETCPVCAGLTDAQCADKVEDGGALFWRYKMIGKFATETGVFKHWYKGLIPQIRETAPELALTGLYDVVAKLFPNSNADAGLLSIPGKLSSHVLKFGAINDRNKDLDSLSAFNEFVGQPLDGLKKQQRIEELFKAGIQTALDLGRAPYDREMNPKTYSMVKRYLGEDLDCDVCRYFDAAREPGGFCVGERCGTALVGPQFLNYSLLRFARFIYAIETNDPLTRYARGFYAWLRTRFESTLDPSGGRIRRVIFVLLLSLKLEQMTPWISQCGEEPPDSVPLECRAFATMCNERARARIADVDFNTGNGAFCVESTVFETLFSVESHLRRAGKQLRACPFTAIGKNEPTPQKRFNQFANAVSTYIKSTSPANRTLESRDGKSAKSNLQSFLLVINSALASPGHMTFYDVLSQATADVGLDVVNNSLDEAAGVPGAFRIVQKNPAEPGADVLLDLEFADFLSGEKSKLLTVYIGTFHTSIASYSRPTLPNNDDVDLVRYALAVNSAQALLSFANAIGSDVSQSAYNDEVTRLFDEVLDSAPEDGPHVSVKLLFQRLAEQYIPVKNVFQMTLYQNKKKSIINRLKTLEQAIENDRPHHEQQFKSAVQNAVRTGDTQALVQFKPKFSEPLRLEVNWFRGFLKRAVNEGYANHQPLSIKIDPKYRLLQTLLFNVQQMIQRIDNGLDIYEENPMILKIILNSNITLYNMFSLFRNTYHDQASNLISRKQEMGI